MKYKQGFLLGFIGALMVLLCIAAGLKPTQYVIGILNNFTTNGPNDFSAAEWGYWGTNAVDGTMTNRAIGIRVNMYQSTNYGSIGNTNWTWMDAGGWHNTNNSAAGQGVDIAKGKITVYGPGTAFQPQIVLTNGNAASQLLMYAPGGGFALLSAAAYGFNVIGTNLSQNLYISNGVSLFYSNVIAPEFDASGPGAGKITLSETNSGQVATLLPTGTNFMAILISTNSGGALNTNNVMFGNNVTGNAFRITGTNNTELVKLDQSGSMTLGAGIIGATTIWGSSAKTNGTYVYTGGEILSNALGSVTISGGAITATNSVNGGSWKSPTNAPTANQVITASSTAGDTKWATPSASGGLGMYIIPGSLNGAALPNTTATTVVGGYTIHPLGITTSAQNQSGAADAPRGRLYFSRSVVITNFHFFAFGVAAGSPFGAGTNLCFFIGKNGSLPSGSLVAVLTGNASAITAQDTTHSVSCASGDYIYIGMTNSTALASGDYTWEMEVYPQ